MKTAAEGDALMRGNTKEGGNEREEKLGLITHN